MAGPGVVGGDYDAYSDAYASLFTVREQGDAANDPYGILSDLLEWLGDVGGQWVLDAGCGEGYLARVLESAGSRVTGIDISPRLIENRPAPKMLAAQLAIGRTT
jgi:2-polyprenyl-3-methyl-5-hydroxy-6-metoxy-1,4-benzoquinol methylase